MKKTQIKRVCLVTPAGERQYLNDDFIGNLPDEAILDFLTVAGKTVWIGQNLYKLCKVNGTIEHHRYEVYTVTQYTKSWYNLLLDAIRRI